MIFFNFFLYVDGMLIVGHDMKEIENLQRWMNRFVAMKDSSSTRQTICMKKFRDKRNDELWSLRVKLSSVIQFDVYDDMKNDEQCSHC
ncbi:hypothetical protein CR513_62076, partial [Mucuna pruriens]